jgi:hypothetical protein
MFYSNENQFIKEYDMAARSGKISNYEYQGRLIVPGEDASITVTQSTITVAIGAIPAPTDHPIHAFVAHFEEDIRDVTAQDLRSHQEIIIAGRWHNNGERTKSFEPYIICRVTNAGTATISRYDYEFFGIGGFGDILVFGPDISGECACADIVADTARSKDYSHLSPGLAHSLSLPTGMVWFPVIPSELPDLIVEHAMKIMKEHAAYC